jgi:hypothetical protein
LAAQEVPCLLKNLQGIATTGDGTAAYESTSHVLPPSYAMGFATKYLENVEWKSGHYE